MKRRSRLFVFLPLAISFIIALAIVLLFIPYQSKYIIRLDDEFYFPKVPIIFYDDLNGNGYSDEIDITEYAATNGVASLQIHMNPLLSFNEWPFQGTFPIQAGNPATIGDIDNDGHKKIFLFTCSSDSLFLNIISNFYCESCPKVTRFITRFKPVNGKPHLNIVSGGFHDMDRKGYNDFVFAVCSGFSFEPRNVFIYDVHTDSLKVSPLNGYFISELTVKDLNGNGFNDVIVNGYASQNLKEPADTLRIPIHDQCCWMIVLDHKLNYLFPPVRFPYFGYSCLETIGIPNKKGSCDLYASYLPPDKSGKSVRLYHFNNQGKLLKFDSLPGLRSNNTTNYIFSDDSKKDNTIKLTDFAGELFSFDTALNKIKVKKISTELNEKVRFQSPYISLDVDNDNQQEKIFLDLQRLLLTIFREDLTHPVAFRLPAQDWGFPILSVKKVPGKDPQLVLYGNNSEAFLSYRFNPYYYAQPAIWVAIFLAVYLLILLVLRIQRLQIEKQQRTEKKITELQLKILRNQMDPHFTLNAVNSVIASVQQNEKQQAADHLLHFSQMYRHIVLTADKIKCTLEEEIDFTRNYLIMEQFRYKDKFTFDISVNADINPKLEVPKMIIQSPVENAVKHGLLNLSGKGHLQINAYFRDQELLLEVIDNGIGRKKASEFGLTSTGKGIKIMEEFLSLYQKTTGTKVTTTIDDMINEDGNAQGTKVIIRISTSQ